VHSIQENMSTAQQRTKDFKRYQTMPEETNTTPVGKLKSSHSFFEGDAALEEQKIKEKGIGFGTSLTTLVAANKFLRSTRRSLM
jgi:hypothetical protein